MRILIRQVTRDGGNETAFRDSELETNELSIGSGPDQNLVLRGQEIGIRHALIRKSLSGAIVVTSFSPAGLSFNGKIQSNGRIEIGDEVQIGSHRIRRIGAPVGFDLAVEVERGEVAADKEWSPTKDITKNGLPLGWGIRGWSWLLGLSFLVAGLAIPALGIYLPQVQKVLESNRWIPINDWWSPGPLISAHTAPGGGSKCGSCHSLPFKRVRNQECGECHERVSRHAEPDSKPGSELAAKRCGTCHVEHLGKEIFVPRDTESCVRCHGNLNMRMEGKTDIQDVRNFSKDHPEFRPTFLYMKADGNEAKWEPVRMSLALSESREHSNLKFNHKIHLDSGGIDTPKGKKVLKCKSCHEPDLSGVRMKTINMKEHCSECHTLQYENVSLPHANVEQVIYVLRGYYQKPLTSAEIKREPDVMSLPRRGSRLPGEPMTESASQKGGTAEEKASRAAKDIFERTLCQVCHEITQSEIRRETTWLVRPVRLNQNWMPKSFFSHKSHLQTECKECHKAENSEKSEDVLMPKIEICRKCHGNPDAPSGLLSDCVTCHRFHLPANRPIFTKSDSMKGAATSEE